MAFTMRKRDGSVVKFVALSKVKDHHIARFTTPRLTNTLCGYTILNGNFKVVTTDYNKAEAKLCLKCYSLLD